MGQNTRDRRPFRVPVGWMLFLTVLLGLLAAYLQSWLSFEHRIAVIRTIELNMGGRVDVEKRGPDWLRRLTGIYHHHGIRANPAIGILDRVVEVDLSYQRRSQSKVTDDFLQQLRVFEHLQELDLSYSKVTDGGMIHIAEIPSLRKLRLAHIRVNGRGFGHLRSLPHLETVSLSYTPVRDKALDHLRAISSLRHVSLHGCRHLTIEGVDRFQRSHPTCELHGLHHGDVHLSTK